MAIPLQIFDVRAPRYELRGECKRCGACCVQEECEQFSPAKGRKKASCLIHEKGKPEKCLLFPELPPIAFPRCGFYFYDKWESRIVKPGEV